MRGRVVAALLVVLAACGGSEPLTSTDQDRVVGLIVEIEPEEGTTVEGFVVEENDGDSFDIRIDQNLDYGFDLNHLREHMDGDLPVDVDIDQRDDRLIALSIEDV